MAKRQGQNRKAYGKWLQYPEAKVYRGGCKVGWNYYRSKSRAEQCAKAACHNAVIAAAEGYDFGYCAPGSIREIKEDWVLDGVNVKGWYEVCLP